MKKEVKDKLLDFFYRDLSEKEKEEFLEKASLDKELIRELVNMSELNEAFEDVYGFNKNAGNRTKSNFTRNLTIILSSAVVTFIGLFLGIQYFKFQNDPGKFLFEENYEPFDVSLTRSADHLSEKKTVSYLQLYSLYIQKDYETLIKVDLDALNKDEIKESVYILLGISSIEVGEFENAKNLFQQVDQNSSYSSIAKWYLILLRVKDNQFENIIPELDMLIANNLMFMVRAENLKEQILKNGLIN
ncbi:MAG: hypothetical protein P1P82_09745 [Bacteroidales bacterium]|nr:hypothetical protein [Bacteroidales bacterium]MDT8431226.1 hypothetical protein [Bacteroidales bacterium]